MLIHNRGLRTPTTITSLLNVFVVNEATKSSSNYCFCGKFRSFLKNVTTNTGEVSNFVVFASLFNHYFRGFVVICG